MADGGRQNADERLAVGLASGLTVVEAASAAGLGERTAFRRLADPEFCRHVSQLRGEMVVRAVGRIADAMTDAVGTLRSLLTCESLPVRLGAAKTLLELGVRFREAVDLEQRLTELEARTNDTNGQCDPGGKAGVRIVEDRDWYGNSNRLKSETTA